ncbi:hypothetical protein [Haloarchaeobius sp. TZWSO28]|uniref:hypothetical protein n=1 Tax=Haloarchaeobius sp. TZWSO28 TaxID=3446119 RepID=UPI003EB9AE98
MDCAETGCDREAAVRLHIPWAADRDVCVAHARGFGQQEGVVTEPLDGKESEWP